MGAKMPFVDDRTSPDIFASGLWSVEPMGPVCRLIWYVERFSADAAKYAEPVVSIVIPTAQILAMLMILGGAVEGVGPTIFATPIQMN